LDKRDERPAGEKAAAENTADREKWKELRATRDAAYDKLVRWQKVLDYERWLITHGRQGISENDGTTDGGNAGGSNPNPENGPGFDGGKDSKNGGGLARDLIYKVPGSHDKHHYDEEIRAILSSRQQ
jgi:hypothetical protein